MVGVINDVVPDQISVGGLFGVGLVVGADLELDTTDIRNVRLLNLNLRFGFGVAAKASVRSVGVLATLGEATGSQFPVQFGAVVAGGIPVLGVPIGGAFDARVGFDLKGAVVSGGVGVVSGGAVCAPCGTVVIPIGSTSSRAAGEGRQ